MEHVGRNDPRLGRAEAQSKRTLPCGDYLDTWPAGTAKIMTIEESLKRRLDVRLAKHGESDFSAQQLKAQLASLKHFKRVKLAEASQKFHLGARQGPPEAHPMDHREDMYGNVIPDDQDGTLLHEPSCWFTTAI